MPFAAIWMDLEIVILSEVREVQYCMILLIYVIYIFLSTYEVIYKTEIDIHM